MGCTPSGGTPKALGLVAAGEQGGEEAEEAQAEVEVEGEVALCLLPASKAGCMCHKKVYASQITQLLRHSSYVRQLHQLASHSDYKSAAADV